ncbi:hypothetical protein JCM12298_29490 [Desulfothermus naphthae]
MTNKSEFLTKEKIYPSEKIILEDSVTGVPIYQITNWPANHSNLYYTKTSFMPNDQNKVIILSCRTGYSNLFLVSLEDSKIIQLTNHKEDIVRISPCISPDGKYVYYAVGSTIRSLELLTLKESVIAEFPNCYAGHLSISKDGEFLLTQIKPTLSIRRNIKKLFYCFKSPFKKESSFCTTFNNLFIAVLSRYVPKNYRVVTVSTRKPFTIRVIKEVDASGITLLSPNNEHILIHKVEREIWVCDLDGKNYRHLYGQGTGKWITHPNWLSDDEIIAINWPNGLIGINMKGEVRMISQFNFRHPTVRSDRNLIVCDTTLPDTGIYAINPLNGEKKLLFHSKSSEQKQWKKKTPAKKNKIFPFFVREPYGSEWHHPHASFSPDGSKIIFNSTRGGKYSQVYIAEVKQILNDFMQS